MKLILATFAFAASVNAQTFSECKIYNNNWQRVFTATEVQEANFGFDGVCPALIRFPNAESVWLLNTKKGNECEYRTASAQGATVCVIE